MIDWLLGIIGQVPDEDMYIVYIAAAVLVIIVVTNIINLFFSPFKRR